MKWHIMDVANPAVGTQRPNLHRTASYVAPRCGRSRERYDVVICDMGDVMRVPESVHAFPLSANDTVPDLLANSINLVLGQFR